MSIVRKVSWVLCLVLFSARVQAQSISLQNLTEDDFKKAIGDLSANFLHTSVSGAGTLGHIFGFEIGVVGGQTNTPHLNEVVQKGDPSSSAKNLPHGEILGVITVPYGLTVELGIVPKVGSEKFKFNSTALAVKWTATDSVLVDLPVSLALKASYTKAGATFMQELPAFPGNSTEFKFDNTSTMLAALVSKDLAIFEPYFGIGLVNSKGDLSASGPGTLFDPSYSSSQSASLSRSSTLWMVGTEIKLVFAKLGAEYSSVYGANRISGKLSFYF